MLRWILGDPRERRLTAELRRRCAEAGEPLPRAVRVRVEGERARLEGATTPATAPVARDGGPHPLLVDHAVATARNLALLRERRALALRLRGDVDALTSPWTRLVHPLALRFAMYDLGDRGRGPYDWMQGSSGRVRDFHYQLRDHGTIEFTRMMVMGRDDPDAVESLFTFLPLDDGVQRAQVVVTRTVPEAAVHALEGRPLGDLLSVPPSGDDELDEAVSGLVVERVRVGERSTIATLAPARWLPWAPPPAGEADWHLAARYRA